ncbi:flavin reductase family protein [Paenibacillus chitinolyticus]
MRTPTDDQAWYSYPGMVAVVTSRYGGRQNVMASGWHTYIGSSPGIYGISLRKETHTYTLIEKSGVFGVHFLPGSKSELIQAVGTFSGRDMDKYKEFGIAYDNGLLADIPVLRDAYYAYECRVMDIRTYGDHEWIAGEILQRYKDEEMFLDNGLPDLGKLQIPLYMGRSTYRIVQENTKEARHLFG